MSLDRTVFVFSGHFQSIEDAGLYTEPQWESEPDETVSDEEYKAWEDRNPTHPLKRNINSYLDEDFIETIDDIKEISRHDYLTSLLKNEHDIHSIKAAEPQNANTFILVFQEALGDLELKNPPISTPELTFCGEYHYTQ